MRPSARLVLRKTEYALNKMYGYGSAPRRPLLPLKQKEGDEFMSVLKELLDLEAELMNGEQ